MPYFVGNLLELPLTTTQDYSLFHILGDYSIELWKEEISAVLAANGLISFITHPDYLVEPRALGVYRDLLEHLSAAASGTRPVGDRSGRDRSVVAAAPGDDARAGRATAGRLRGRGATVHGLRTRP